jgi:hypothetical protein
MQKSRLFLPSISDIIFLTIFLSSSFIFGQAYLRDADTGLHIRAGEIMLQNFSILRQDPFSWITPALAWQPYEWLSQVLIAGIYRFTGLAGTVVLFALLVSLTYLLLFKILKSECQILFAVAILLLVILSSHFRWLARPHIFSLLFTVIWYFILESYVRGGKNYLFLLPLTMLFWVNLHGGFMIGFVLCGIYWIGNVAEYSLSDAPEKGDRKRKLLLLSVVLLASLICALANPRGIGGICYPFTIMSEKFQMDFIEEFRSPNFHQAHFFQFVLYAILVVFAISKKKPTITEVILLIVFTHMALYSVRNVALCAVIGAPILARNTPSIRSAPRARWIEFLRQKGDGIAAIDQETKGGWWPLIGIFIVIFCLSFGKMHYQFPETQVPLKALKFIEQVEIPGRMFNDETFGEHIIYRLWPRYKVFYYSRHWMFGTERLKEYLEVVQLEPGWEDVIVEHGIDWFFIPAKAPLSLFLKEKGDWRLIYSDTMANIFLRNKPENYFLIEKYLVNQASKEA